MSAGIWFATTGEYPGFDGVAFLLPTNRFRGFAAVLTVEEDALAEAGAVATGVPDMTRAQ